MKKYTITEKEYAEMVEAMNTLTSENQKLRGFIDGMREQLIIGGVSKSFCNHEFVGRMLELGAELDKAVSPIQISMVINDAEILYKNHIEQLNIPVVVQAKPEKVCKWSWQLGNNCKTCKRCLDKKPS